MNFGPQHPAARPTRDRPWVMRTYAGHSSAAASNELYRRNLAKGQTGLSVAFDLPTEIRNAIARIEILGEGSAGAVHLLDERGKRRRVGLVFGGTADQAQPLLAPDDTLGLLGRGSWCRGGIVVVVVQHYGVGR